MKVHVSEITAQGFKLHIFGKKYDKEFLVSRETFAWFLGATNEEIIDVSVASSVYPGHGYAIRWDSLDVDLGTVDFEDPESRQIYDVSTSEREKYHKIHDSINNENG